VGPGRIFSTGCHDDQAKSGARAFHRVPAEGGVEIVEKKTIRTGKRQTFGRETFAFACFMAPNEDAFEVRIAIDKERFGGLKRDGKFVEKKAKRFGKALIHLHGRGDMREIFILSCKIAAAFAEKGNAGTSRESRGRGGEPGNDTDPLNVGARGGDQNNAE
jgi:hypothetical protein